MSKTNQNIINNYISGHFSYQIDREDVTVIVPTLNEELSVGLVIQNLLLEGFSKILVVDGNSVDNTVSKAREYDVKIVQQKGKGKGDAIRTALEHINTPYLVLIDADSTYNPNEIDMLLEKAPLYNQVIGARQDRLNIKLLNRFGNDVINGIFNLFLGTDLRDVCSGMYSLKTDYAKSMPLASDGFDIEVEIAAHCSSNNSIKEVPISYNKRVGKQKLNSIRDGARIILSILNLGRKFNPIVFYSFVMAAILASLGSTFIALQSFSAFNGIAIQMPYFLDSLLIAIGVQFFMLGIIVSQINHVYRYYALTNIEKKNRG